MSRQGLLCPLWHESLAEPRTSWITGRPGPGRLVYGSAGLPAGGGLFGNCETLVDVPGWSPQARMPDRLGRAQEGRFLQAGTRSYGIRFMA